MGDEVKSIEDLTNLVLMDMKLDGIAPIHVSDVADVEMTDNSDETYAIVNGNPGIMLSMEKQTGYSTGDVTDRLLDKLDSLEKENDGLHTTVLMNQGVYIDMVVKSVMENMIVGAILAISVLLLFLKDISQRLHHGIYTTIGYCGSGAYVFYGYHLKYHFNVGTCAWNRNAGG